MRIVDTHLHLIYPDRFSYPWLAGEPTINKPWSNESYWAEALHLGVEAAIHMEVDVIEPQMVEESRFVLGLDRVIGAIANGRPERDGFEKHLEMLAALGKVVGVRRLIQGQPAEMSQTETFRANLRLLPKFGMNFDICEGFAGALDFQVNALNIHRLRPSVLTAQVFPHRERLTPTSLG